MDLFALQCIGSILNVSYVFIMAVYTEHLKLALYLSAAAGVVMLIWGLASNNLPIAATQVVYLIITTAGFIKLRKKDVDTRKA